MEGGGKMLRHTIESHAILPWPTIVVDEKGSGIVFDQFTRFTGCACTRYERGAVRTNGEIDMLGFFMVVRSVILITVTT